MVSKNKKSVSRGKNVSNRNLIIGIIVVVLLLVLGYYMGGYGVTGNVVEGFCDCESSVLSEDCNIQCNLGLGDPSFDDIYAEAEVSIFEVFVDAVSSAFIGFFALFTEDANDPNSPNYCSIDEDGNKINDGMACDMNINGYSKVCYYGECGYVLDGFCRNPSLAPNVRDNYEGLICPGSKICYGDKGCVCDVSYNLGSSNLACTDPDKKLCNFDNECVECLASNNDVNTGRNSNCPISKRTCNANDDNCVQCSYNNDKQCPGKCDLVNSVCLECNDNSHCASNTAKKVCDTIINECVECIFQDNCKSYKECNTVTKVCEPASCIWPFSNTCPSHPGDTSTCLPSLVCEDCNQAWNDGNTGENSDCPSHLSVCFGITCVQCKDSYSDIYGVNPECVGIISDTAPFISLDKCSPLGRCVASLI